MRRTLQFSFIALATFGHSLAQVTPGCILNCFMQVQNGVCGAETGAANSACSCSHLPEIAACVQNVCHDTSPADQAAIQSAYANDCSGISTPAAGPTAANPPDVPSVTTTAQPNTVPTDSSGVSTTASSPANSQPTTSPNTPSDQSIVNNTVSNSDPRILYQPPDAWKAGNITGCDGNAVKRSTTIGSSLAFSFTGTAIYLNTANNANSGVYNVTLDNQGAVPVDGFVRTATNCKTGFSAENLDNGPHTINVTLAGPAPEASLQATEIDFSSFMFTSVNSGPSGGSGGGGSGSGSGGSGTSSASTSRSGLVHGVAMMSGLVLSFGLISFL